MLGNRTEDTAGSSLLRSRWAAIGAAIAVSLGAGGVMVARAAPGPAESTIVSVAPERILDTRDPVNVGLPGPFVSPVGQKLQVTGSVLTTTGPKVVVPAGATGVLLNVTSVGANANGFISVRPGDASGAPSTSSLNVNAGVAVPNAVQVSMPTAGAGAGMIDITWDAYGVNGKTTDILIDVVGYTTNTGLQQLVADVAAKADTDEVNAVLATKVNAADVLFASITPSGAIEPGTSSGLVSSVRTDTGSYTLTFNRDVEECVVVTTDQIFSETRDVSADTLSGGIDQIVVRVTNAAEVLENTYFSVIVQCPSSATGAPLEDVSERSSPNP